MQMQHIYLNPLKQSLSLAFNWLQLLGDKVETKSLNLVSLCMSHVFAAKAVLLVALASSGRAATAPPAVLQKSSKNTELQPGKTRCETM